MFKLKNIQEYSNSPIQEGKYSNYKTILRANKIIITTTIQFIKTRYIQVSPLIEQILYLPMLIKS